jgi:hypothetical protein
MYTWIKCFGIPVYAWEDRFFKFLFLGRGTIMELDEPTTCISRLDVARVKIRMQLSQWCNRIVKIKINDFIFDIILVEEMIGDRDQKLILEYKKQVHEEEEESESEVPELGSFVPETEVLAEDDEDDEGVLDGDETSGKLKGRIGNSEME